jgi:hypothetical protein
LKNRDQGFQEQRGRGLQGARDKEKATNALLKILSKALLKNNFIQHRFQYYPWNLFE